jgi:hypothetical protein
MARTEQHTTNPTMTLGEIRAQLAHLPDETPVVFYVSDDDWYHNIEGWTFDTDADSAVTFGDGGPMDTRQW